MQKCEFWEHMISWKNHERKRKIGNFWENMNFGKKV